MPNHLNINYGTLFEAALMDQVLEHKAISALNLWQKVSIVKNDQTPILLLSSRHKWSSMVMGHKKTATC